MQTFNALIAFVVVLHQANWCIFSGQVHDYLNEYANTLAMNNMGDSI